jgi:hypothetical protein
MIDALFLLGAFRESGYLCEDLGFRLMLVDGIRVVVVVQFA